MPKQLSKHINRALYDASFVCSIWDLSSGCCTAKKRGEGSHVTVLLGINSVYTMLAHAPQTPCFRITS